MYDEGIVTRRGRGGRGSGRLEVRNEERIGGQGRGGMHEGRSDERRKRMTGEKESQKIKIDGVKERK